MFALKNVRHFNNVSKSLPFIGSTKISKTILKTDNKICVFSVRHESIKLRSSFIYKYKLDHITPYGFSLLVCNLILKYNKKYKFIYIICFLYNHS